MLCESLSSGINNVRGLQTLDISAGCLDRGPLTASLAQSLLHVPGLRTLKIKGDIDGAGVTCIAQALVHVPGLSSLAMERNDFSDEETMVASLSRPGLIINNDNGVV